MHPYKFDMYEHPRIFNPVLLDLIATHEKSGVHFLPRIDLCSIRLHLRTDRRAAE